MSDTLQYLTDDSGQRTAVGLPISDYEKLLEDLSFDATASSGRNVTIDAAYVNDKLEEAANSQDLARYVL